jgi:uncharacterized iron-regulated membrane protein
MLVAWLLRLHRWIALMFALPLVFVLGTGLILSFEPWLVTGSIQPGSLTVAKIEALLAKHDPQGRARSLAHRPYDGTLTLSAGRGGGTVIDIATGETRPGPSTLASVLQTSRRMHETLLLDARWLVVSSSIVMLVLATFGILMGLPRIDRTLSGWHKGMAWGLLPLIVLSPATSLLMWFGVTFTGGAPRAPQGGELTLQQAVRIVGDRHDLSTLVSIRQVRGRLTARLVEGGEYRVYGVTADGTTAAARNWPRLWHEGNFAGAWSSLMNAVLSLAMIGLLVTGPLIWLRRQVLLRRRRQTGSLSASPAE